MSLDTWTANREGDPTPARAAADMLAKHWDGRLPVDPQRIAAALGIQVVARGGPDDPDYVYSGYFDSEGERPVIEYNTAESQLRQRFTVAHELGHYALGHASAPRDTPDNFNTAVKDACERQANQFAAELLMPASALRALVQSGKFGDIGALASAFRTSKVAMGYRMQNLGIIR